MKEFIEQTNEVVDEVYMLTGRCESIREKVDYYLDKFIKSEHKQIVGPLASIGFPYKIVLPNIDMNIYDTMICYSKNIEEYYADTEITKYVPRELAEFYFEMHKVYNKYILGDTLNYIGVADILDDIDYVIKYLECMARIENKNVID